MKLLTTPLLVAASFVAMLLASSAVDNRHTPAVEPADGTPPPPATNDSTVGQAARPDFTDKLASYVTFQGPRPHIVMLVAPCRSGTTAMSRAVAYAGQTVVYQKIKEALRLVLVAELGDKLTAEEQAYFHVDSTPEESLALPTAPEPEDGSPPTLFLKETFGGAHPLESYYDPLSVLLKAGWTSEQVTVITMVREPLASFASWVQHWGPGAKNGHGGASMERLAGNYAAAIAAIANTRAVAKAAGVNVVSLDYEAFARSPPATVLGAVLVSSGLHSASLGAAEATSSWLTQPDPLTGDGARLHMPRGDGHIEYLRSVHAALLNSPSLQYFRRTTAELVAVVGDEWATCVAADAAPVIDAVRGDCSTMVGRWAKAVDWSVQQAAVAAAAARPDLTSELAKHVNFTGPRPRIVLLVAPCKSGTTALGRAVARTGQTVVFHRIKVALKRLLVQHLVDQLSRTEKAYFDVRTPPGEALELPQLPQPSDGSTPTLFMVETFCGGHGLMAYYDPLSVLLEAGWPADAVTVISMVREPLACFASWVDQWGETGAQLGRGANTTTEHLAATFVSAMAAVANTRHVAKASGVPVVSLDYEAFARSPPATVLGAVLTASGLHGAALSADNATAAWANYPDPVAAVSDRLRLPKDALQAEYLRSVHGSLLMSRGFSYRRRRTPELMLVVGEEWATNVHGSTAGVYLAIQKDCVKMMRMYKRAVAAVVKQTTAAVAEDAARPDFTDKLASYVTFQGPRPHIVMLVAPCRSGTTAMSRAVAYAGQTVVYQKIKEALRLVLVAELGDKLTAEEQAYFHVDSTPEESLALPTAPEPEDGSPPTLFLKETFGGAHPLESYYDPLSVLLKAGWTSEQVTVITMVREPLASFASWVQHWGPGAKNGHGGASMERLAGNYAAAIAAIANTRAVAKAAGVNVVSLDYEAFARSPPAAVLGAVLGGSGLHSASLGAAEATSSWLSHPDPLTGDGARLHMPRGDGHIEYLRSVHAALLKSPGLQYVRKPTPALLAVVGDEWATKVYASAVAVYTAVQRDAMSLVQKWQTAVQWANELAVERASAARPDLTTRLAKAVSFTGRRPRIVLVVAPCKSGNTAIVRSMAESGYTVAHQKIKSALRLVLLEHLGESLSSSEQEYFDADTTPEAVLALPEVTPHTVDARPTLIMKETFCAGHKLEAYYDPLTVLLEAGWTPDMLTVVSVAREPLASFASWVTQYGHNNSHGHPGRDRKALASSFHAAMAAVSNTRDVARSAGVPVVSVDYEAFDRGTPAAVMGAVFAACHLHTHSGSVAPATSWSTSLDPLTSFRSSLRLPGGVRSIAYLRSVHTSLLQSSGIEYRRPNTSALMGVVTEEWATKVHGATVGMYHRIQKSCMDMMKRYQRALLAVGVTAGVGVQDPTSIDPDALPLAAAPAPAAGSAASSNTGACEERSALQGAPYVWAGMGKEGWLVVATILIATRMAMSATALPGRRRCHPGRVAIPVLAVWLAVSWAGFGGRWASLLSGGRDYWAYLDTQNDAFRAADLYVQRSDLPRVAWGIATAWARQPPTVQILGAQKAGTTSLHAMLLQHPDVVGGVAKESHFVDGRSVFGTSFHNVSTPRDVAVARYAYASMFPSVVARWWHAVTHRGRSLVVVDATPANIFLPAAPHLLRAVTPDAKLVVVLRDPVDRAWSHYRHNRKWQRENSDLAGALRAEDELWAAADADVAAGQSPAPTVAMLDKSYVRRSRYADQLARYTAAFPRHQLLVLSFDDVTSRPHETMARVFAFLGLPPVEVVAEAKNANPAQASGAAASVPGAVRALLAPLFSRSNSRLVAEFGVDFAGSW